MFESTIFTQNMLWVAVGGVVITIFKQTLLNYFILFRLYRGRGFDADNNPDTPEFVEIFNPGVGNWELAKVRYDFNPFNVRKRGAYVQWISKDGIATEKFSIIDWNNPAIIRKRVPIKKSIEKV